ncbi:MULTISPECIES: hypothetical protein [Actinomadura]|uniref:Uncharacterized protein n=1 Tax=Actinomadura yumaensis TaxID=111807 RepID=A0ABW2CRW1_9ACTN|nr:hypothetical protein [Actinomadura sp. J1-007]MWK39730.1 hypothetical protein [Actinomadura sp. J1-007]
MRWGRFVCAAATAGVVLVPAVGADASAGTAVRGGSSQTRPGPAVRAADPLPAFIVDVLLGQGYIRVDDGRKSMGFDLTVMCRALIDMRIVVRVKQQVNGIDVSESRPLSCVRVNEQSLLTYRFADERWTTGPAVAEAALFDQQGGIIHEFQRTITVTNW